MCWSADSRDQAAARLVRAAMVDYLRQRVEDKSRLVETELVIGELIGNVVKHSPGAFCTEIEWDDDGRPTIVVHDGGECFRLPDAVAQTYAESGRGLSIIQALVEGVEVRSFPPEGCVVRVTLDLHHKMDDVRKNDECPFRRSPDRTFCMRPMQLRKNQT